MRMLDKARLRLRSLFQRGSVEAELDAELRFHLDELTEENLAAGMEPGEARASARCAIGGMAQLREECRDMRRLNFVDDMIRDLRHAVRLLVRTPRFTAIAVLTLALGIGATIAIFSVVNGVLLQPLSYPGADRLVSVWHHAPGMPGLNQDAIDCSPSIYFTYFENNQTFEQFGVWEQASASVTGVGEPQQVEAVSVTYGTLDALGVRPLLGHWFSRDEDTPGQTEETVMLAYGYWQRRFGGNADVLGRAIQVDGRPRRVIGVMPEDFRFLSNAADLLLPLRFDRARTPMGNFGYHGIARLKPGVTLERADADVGRMLGIWLEWPSAQGGKSFFVNARFSPALRPLRQDVVGDAGRTLWVLMGTIGLVLLIACANVANLLLVRAEGRRQEFAVRAALGAGWWRIALELLFESLTLGLLGGILGTGLAGAALRLLVAAGPASLPRLNEIGLDPRALAFAVTVSLVSGLMFGSIAVFKYAGPQIAGELRGGGRALSASRERHRARNLLVVVQVALALVLLMASGLMIRTFQNLRRVSPGFHDPAQVELLHIAIPEAQAAAPEQVMRLQQAMAARLAAIPGVASVGFSNGAPLEGFNYYDPVYDTDKQYQPGEIPPTRRFYFITPGYFASLGTPVIAGRDYTWTDLYEGRTVAIISENLAREWWGSAGAALGKRIRASGPPREVIGVAGDVRDDNVQAASPKIVYWPALVADFWGSNPRPTRGGVFAVRTSRAATASFLEEARQAIWSVNSDQPVYLVRTLADVYNQSMARTSFTLTMLAVAGGMALLLGLIGIYGVISYAVSQRRREMGIRLALGAQPSTLRAMFVRHALLLAMIGAAMGLAAAAVLTRLMTSLLFEVNPVDPLTYVAAAVVLMTAAVAASYLPARRAAAVDPLETLRSE